MKCKICKIREREGKNDICSSCRLKKWRRDNPDKIKAYLERTKDHRRDLYRKYYADNMDETKEKLRIIGQTEGFKKSRREKSKTYEEVIRRQTRLKYPLKGEKCIKCSDSAKFRHHTTIPMTVDDFIFLCHKHHMKEHNKVSHEKKCVIKQKNDVSQEKHDE